MNLDTPEGRKATIISILRRNVATDALLDLARELRLPVAKVVDEADVRALHARIREAIRARIGAYVEPGVRWPELLAAAEMTRTGHLRRIEELERENAALKGAIRGAVMALGGQE